MKLGSFSSKYHPKWLQTDYTVALKFDGTLDGYKAQVPAQGYTHIHGIEYAYTFTPEAPKTTVQSILAIASSKSWSIFQMEEKGQILYGDLKGTGCFDCFAKNSL